MNKINWENSPSTATPINADNLNAMQEYIEEAIEEAAQKNIITAKRNSNYTISQTDTTEEIKGFVEYNKQGTKLSVVNGVIKIGAGVSKVKVSYNALTRASSSATTKRMFTYLKKNSSVLSQESSYFETQNTQKSVSLPPVVIDVNEGDEIFLQVYGPSGYQVYGDISFLWTTITVEVIE